MSELSKERHHRSPAAAGTAGVQTSLELQKEQLGGSLLGLRELRAHLDFLFQGP